MAVGLALCFAPGIASPPHPAMAAQGEKGAAAALPQGYVDANAIIMRGPQYFEQYAREDNPEAAFFTGYNYIMQGFPDRAFDWISQAANSKTKIVEAWYFMGYLYSAGLTPEGRDLFRAETWFDKAARTGDIDAGNQLYFIRLLGPDDKPNPAAAFLLAEQLAGKKDPVALNNLGLMYEFGIGIEPDILMAVQSFKAAASLDNPSAHYNLGRMYEKGLGVQQNPGMAAQEFLVAANLDYAPAQIRVARMMRDGRNFTQNYFNALEWFEKAAGQYNVDALYETGRMYEEGLGTTKNINKAGTFYQEAVKAGHIPSIMRMGKLKEIGVPSQEDLTEAYGWYQLAYLLAKDDETKNAAMDARENVADALPDDARMNARRQAELRSKNLLELQDKFQQLADGVTIDMFANPATPRHFPVDLVRRALKDTAPAVNKN